MKILSQHQIRTVDSYTVEHEPVSSIDLMERAATACVYWITGHFDANRPIAVFAGPGNNGGDGLAIARIMQRMRYNVSIYMLTDETLLSPDAHENYHRLTVCSPELLNEKKLPELLPSTVVIDALFGIGLTRPLDGVAARVVEHINKSGCTVIAIDVPSGLFCDDNRKNHSDKIIKARYTLSFQQPKLPFFFSENEIFVGEWKVSDIGILPKAIDQQKAKFHTIERQDVLRYVQPRSKFSHKGTFGHACIIAGHRGMMGACVLAAKACMRTGVGLITTHIPHGENNIMQISVPEALCSLDDDAEIFTRHPDLATYSAIAIGPGIGQKPQTHDAMFALLQQMRQHPSLPLLLDADALNILAEHPSWLNQLPPNTVITPHPKEFDRIAGHSANGHDRHIKQVLMAHQYALYIVLKGAHTSIATPDGSCFFNTSGNPGMATAGSGDVLTGMIVSLLAQGWSTLHAVCGAVWLHGVAGDLAAAKQGQEAMIASDVIKNIGKAFKTLRKNEWEMEN